MRVLGIDPRVTEPPAGMVELSTPDRLEVRLGEADFVILTTPETPDTLGMFNATLFSRMKRGAYFINIARGRCVVTQDLIAALQSGQLAVRVSMSPTRSRCRPTARYGQCPTC